jgi:hypothetical protein
MSAPPVTSRSTPGSAPSLIANDGRVPVVLGVTGHRSLRRGDEDAISVQLRALFGRIRKEAPHSPIVLLSALAEGADRLVARVALAEGAGLIPVLPFEQANYELDFPDAHSRDDFRALLLDPRTERIIVAPRLDPAADAPGAARDHQYLLAGLFIARNSDVLIALWDGAEARGTGGSADIVAFRQSGRLEPDDVIRDALALAPEPFRIADAPLDAPQTGLVYHVPVSRSSSAPSTDPSGASWLVPAHYDVSPQLRERFVRSSMSTLHHRDELNREGVAYRARRGGRVASSEASLTAGQTTPSTMDTRAPGALASLRATFGVADALAIEHQKSIYRTMVALFSMIAIATIALVLRNLAMSEQTERICLAAYLLLLALADLAYLRTRRRGSQDRFQDYRAIAEGLRVQFFWRVAGARQDVSDYYLRKQRSELRWIRDLLRVSALRAPMLAAGDFAAVQRLWVKAQGVYYHGAGNRDGGRRRRQRMIGSALVLLSFGATVKWMIDLADGRVVYIAIAAFAAIVLASHGMFEYAHATSEAEAPTQSSVRDTVVLALLSGAVAVAFYSMLVIGGPIIMRDLPQLSIKSVPFDWMLAAIGITALVGTFAHAYANVRAFGEHQKQYERMEELFKDADRALDRAATRGATNDAARVLSDLGCEALAEHADWLLLHRARPIELPTADL